MLDPRLLLTHYRLRRPLSRKIRVRTAAILTEPERGPLLASLQGADARWSLETSLRYLALVFAGRYADCDALLKEIIASGRAEDYARLILESDLRKFVLACFRDHLTQHGTLPHEAATRLLKFSYLLDPEVASIYADGATETARRPLTFDYAPRVPSALKVSILFRKYYFGRASRLHDLPVRFKTPFDDEGIHCRLWDPNIETNDMDRCDLALVDDAAMFPKDPAKKRAFLENLRQKSARVGMIEPDPWVPDFPVRLAASRHIYDFVWTMAPSMLVDGKIHGAPACMIPFPVGFGAIFDEFRAKAAHASLPNEPLFCGAVENYNFHRLFWVLAGYSFRRPFRSDITSHQTDALSVEQSIRAYLARLLASRTCLNFTMRADGRRSVVGRTSDALRAGQLLVQEYAEEMHAYFEPGRHYVEFRNVDELEDICFHLADPHGFEDVRNEGARFFQERYSDNAVVRHIATYL